jgi:hypothetical protein
MPRCNALRRFAILLALPVGLSGQSLTDGGLDGLVTDRAGRPLGDATITVDGPALRGRLLTSDGAGRFGIPVLRPGRYTLLIEQLGYQPIRLRDVPVEAGVPRRVVVALTPMAPPVRVDDRPWGGVPAAGATERFEVGPLDRFDARRDATDLTRGTALVDAPRDGRGGFAASAAGRPAGESRLMVDGVEETLLWHPGLPDAPAATPLFARDGLASAALSGFALDGEVRATPGQLLALQTARGGDRFQVRPYGSFSTASLGGRTEDNPADSAAASLQLGVAMGGPIKGDTSGWFLRADIQRLKAPTADPFARDDFDAAEAAEAIVAAADAVANRDVTTFIRPTVRSVESMSAFGRGDWAIGRRARVGARVGMATWDEDNLHPGRRLVSGAGQRLESRDLSLAGMLAVSGEAWTSETRLGIRNATREWFGAALPETELVEDGLAFGGVATMPGRFEERAVELGEAFTYTTGAHTIKVGGLLARRALTYNWLVNGGGRATFGSIDDLALGRGMWVSATGGSAEEIALLELAGFIQDEFRVSNSLSLMLGLRYANQSLPDQLARENTAWGLVSGTFNGLVPTDNGGAVGPRGALTLDVGGRGRTVVRVAGGLVPGRYDAATLAEVARYDGDVRVRRASGTIGWPTPGASIGRERTALTLFGPGVRQPRSYAGEAALTQWLAAGTTLTVAAGYRHTDYLLRRSDLNRLGAAAATLADGRPAWGALEQFGSVLAAAPGSNRRFDEFDQVHALTSSGFTDYTEVQVALTRQVTGGVSVHAQYVWSKTEDNLVGQLSADPADRLSPLEGTEAGATWDEGTSDLDIPHRVALTARYDGGGPLTLAARWRWRSGLPFTAGFRSGVDINGDGASNDPVAAGAVAGLADVLQRAGCTTLDGFAVRNSCREDGVQSLDLHAAYRLPFGGRRVALTLDAFNLAATTVGVVDRAAALIDPSRAVTTGTDGRLTLPLVANASFGEILTRRGEPRLIRFGFRVEN